MIPDIAALSLTEGEEFGHGRVIAIRFLVALLQSKGKGEDSDLADDAIAKRVFPLAKRFMTLLRNESMRPSIVQLLSLMAKRAPGMQSGI